MGLNLEDLTRESPFERLGQKLIEIVDKIEDLGAKVCLGGKVASAKHPSGEDAEPDFDLIQPRAMLRCVDKADAVAQVAQKRLPALEGFQHPALAFLPQR